MIGRSFPILDNGTPKIGPLFWRQVGSVLRIIRKSDWTRFSRSSSCSFTEIPIFLLALTHPQRLDDGER